MATKKSHVLLRDGSAKLGGPRPDPPKRPAKPKASRDAGYFLPSGDPQGIKGSFPIDATAKVPIQGRSTPCDKAPWEALPGGRPGPLGGGVEPAGEHTHSKPGDSLPSGVPVPID